MRVVAGTFGGRRLVAPPGDATRPTTDRVREALFSVLEARGAVEGARVLDLFAGTGALGIEALSRGADRATFVEAARAAAAALRENVRALGLEGRASLVQDRAERWARRSGAGTEAHGGTGAEAGTETRAGVEAFDLVLCDPPWAQVRAAADALGALVASGRLAPAALVVLEHAARDEPPAIEGLVEEGRRRWGDTAVWLARPARAASQPSAQDQSSSQT